LVVSQLRPQSVEVPVICEKKPPAARKRRSDLLVNQDATCTKHEESHVTDIG